MLVENKQFKIYFTDHTLTLHVSNEEYIEIEIY